VHLDRYAEGVGEGPVSAVRNGGRSFAGSGSGVGGAIVGPPTINVESFGASPLYADNYDALRAAWDAWSAAGGRLVSPSIAVYNFDARADRLVQGPAQQYAFFPLPQQAADSTHGKKYFELYSPGEAYVPRMWGGTVGSTTAPTVTSAVWKANYSTPFAWDATKGLPSIIGARDMDAVPGYSFSNIHLVVQGLTVRQPQNPSLCSLNLEACSTAHIKDLACDVAGYLDEAPEPTHPTGGALLLPRTDNAVATKVEQFFAWGMYSGVPVTECGDVVSAIVVRCKIGIPIRRGHSHFAHLKTINMQQCPWGVAGYDPSGPGSNDGIVAPPSSWTILIDYLDIEDFDYPVGGVGTVSWVYPPTGPKAHVYDPTSRLSGSIRSRRVDSGSAGTSQNALYVNGATGLSLYTLQDPAVATTRLTGGSPPPTAPPNTPTIGTATPGDTTASVAFTPAATGPVASGFTATSTPGSITGTGSSSPVVVSGLTNGTSYTFTVHASNVVGSSGESAASNSVTPTGTVYYVHDTFTRADSSTAIGTPDVGTAPTAVFGTWGISSNQGYLASASGGTPTAGNYRQAVYESSHADCSVSADVITSGQCEVGLVVRHGDGANFLMVDISYDGTFGKIGIGLFKCVGSTFTSLIAAVNTNAATGSTIPVKLTVAGNVHTLYYNGSQIGQYTGTTGLEANTKHGILADGSTASLANRFDNFAVTA
jgi:prepilin-type processing-associated H-X9-DG protein